MYRIVRHTYPKRGPRFECKDDKVYSFEVHGENGEVYASLHGLVIQEGETSISIVTLPHERLTSEAKIRVNLSEQHNYYRSGRICAVKSCELKAVEVSIEFDPDR